MDDQNKNLILAVVLSGIVLLGWQVFFPAQEPTASVTSTNVLETSDGSIALAPPSTDSGDIVIDATTAVPSTAEQAPRLTIDTDRVQGSISLAGGRIDDLSLKDYTVDIDSDEIVTLLTPVGTDAPYYAVYGWAPGGDLDQDDVPGANTVWSVETGDTLTVDTPITLAWTNAKGLTFRRTIAIDTDYMFSITQSVENDGTDAARLAAYGIVARHGTPDVSKYFVLHEGLVRQADKDLEEADYKDIADYDFDAREGGNVSIEQVEENGWLGFTDKNWMTSLVPQPGQSFTSVVKFVPGSEIYQVESRLPAQVVEPGASVQNITYLFAGAKEWEAIKGYQDDLGIYRFIYSIDWGIFFFFTQPIFRLLHAINGLIGNMGWSIIALTVLIKGIMFPLAYKSYVSMARMKELQPEMEKMKEEAGDDREKLQKGMMELYKKNKVNPASGCLPLILQIPVFFSLYKVIFVTIELRHAPWVGWIRDLSAPDPSSILNLFGLLSFAPPDPTSIFAFISLGILPILLGISMWLQQKLNPAPTDPAQAMIFAWMPWVFMFMLGSFASGLVLYWISNNMITFTQQYLIMRSHGHKPELFANIKKSLRLKKKEGSA
ncbi:MULTISPECIES: membrane protein insertase YidC [Pacificibacter]|uniref:membrane protein insertase YidC n=1 Tax=Pacificibacter TaxID=1042323 RepID=UPI001C09901E|nr:MULTISPECIES: membrane protein insertase YidC [Pacificibacter]MBU2935121.1 membrane protein insertase YidC [Pacificibacter marinus]MDO6615911.1 membrane protein insertase YidC [Pacificibacter sp. 1_MG-2023]